MSKTQALALTWTHGLDGARKRLRETIESGERFDARDRQALAFLLERDPGAGWYAAIVGMFEAIRQNAPRLVERDYGTYDPTRYTCYCPGCGAYMKNLRAGVDEGTDNEWCGACRY